MLTNSKLSRSSKVQMGRTKKKETLEAMEATGKNPEKSFLELPWLCRQLKIPTKICTLVKWVTSSLATLRPRVLATENL